MTLQQKQTLLTFNDIIATARRIVPDHPSADVLEKDVQALEKKWKQEFKEKLFSRQI